MANTAINVSGSILCPDGSSVSLAPPQIVNVVAVGVIQEPTLSTTATTITVPSGAVGFSLQPPANNTIGITLKGISADTGLKVHNTIGIPAMGLDPSVTSFVLVAASAMSSPVVIKFF